ncbi:MAG TPA: cell division FtsA domain-containing protein [Candidatus Dormibacteraeota bacterium]|nr:cell division FtsA domain-containing protein [Candidatus Dormibacteraeota bacterium]
MTQFRFLKNRDDYYRHFTALDLGTDLVKALVIRREATSGVILGVSREPQHPDALVGGAIADLELVVEACNRALEAAEDMAGTVPGQAVVGIAGELVRGFSSSITYPREHPAERVREAELKGMLQLVERRALREAQHLLEMERAYGEVGEVRLVQSAITQVRIDGYPVTSPIGFQGRNLELTVFNTFAPASQVVAIETVARELDLELAAVVSQPYALARAAADDELWDRGGIFVDVGGGTTDVALLRGGGVEGVRRFNLGGQTFTRRLASELGLSYQEAEARKLRHSEGLLAPDEEYVVAQLLMTDVEVLLQALALCLRELARGEVLPPDIFVCGGGSLLPELMEGLGRAVWAEGLPFAEQPRAYLLGPGDVRGVVDSTGQLTSAQDVGPMGLASHALRVESEERDQVSSVMRGVLKGMRA